MRTVLINGRAPVPPGLRDVVQRGSTTLEERAVSELSGSEALVGADRIVFWSAAADDDVRALAEQSARVERAERKEKIVYVTLAPGGAIPGLSPNEIFVWPLDEDRLRMAFMTGA